MSDQQQQQEQPAPPATAAEASARLAKLEVDPQWTAKLKGGDPAIKKQWNDLTLLAAKGGDDVDRAMSGALPDIPEGGLKLMADVAAFLRDAGIRDEVIRETLSDDGVTQAEHDATQIWLNSHLGDREWVKRLKSGDIEAKQKFILSQIILSSSIKDKAA